MPKVESKELYPLFYALHQHHVGKAKLSGVSLQGELLEAVERFGRKHTGDVVRPESPLTVDRVRGVLKLAKHDQDVRILLCEDGPEAPRPRSAEEIHQDEADQEAEIARLVRKFWISLSYGVVALMTAIMFAWWWRIGRKDWTNQSEGPTMEAVNQPQAIDPYKIVFLVLVLIAAWGIAEAFILAKDNWLDFDRARAAVPVIGKGWAARVRRKRRVREDQRNQQNSA